MVRIAVKMYKMGKTVISRDLLFSTVSELIKMFPAKLSSENSVYLNLREGKTIQEFAGEDENSLYAIINDVRICGVLVNDYANDGFVFAHKSFYDLLVAKYFLGKEVKFHDSAMLISRALSSSQAYNMRLKKNFVVRKLLAELIASQITVHIGSANDKIKCRKIFDQCYRVITRTRLKCTPQKLFLQALRNEAGTVKKVAGISVSHREYSRAITLLFIPPVLLTFFCIRGFSIIDAYKAEALAYYAKVPEAYQAAVSGHFQIHPLFILAVTVIAILILTLSARGRSINSKAEIFLLKLKSL